MVAESIVILLLHPILQTASLGIMSLIMVVELVVVGRILILTSQIVSLQGIVLLMVVVE